MHVYLDSSALLKRVLEEAGSADLRAAIMGYTDQRALLVSSTLAWTEVGRALRNRFSAGYNEVSDGAEEALSGVAEHHFTSEVASLARRLNPNVLRSLDAIHLASAMLVDADVLLTYDTRLAAACAQNGLRCEMPGHAPG